MGRTLSRISPVLPLIDGLWQSQQQLTDVIDQVQSLRPDACGHTTASAVRSSSCWKALPSTCPRRTTRSHSAACYVLVPAASGANPAFAGSLGDELRNITFVGEQAAATETLSDWGKYMALDTQIRALETSGHHSEAVALCTGTAPGQSDYAFSQFDDALGKTLGINQDQFDLTVAHVFAGLRLLPLFTGVTILLLVVLTWFGLAPRLREYHR